MRNMICRSGCAAGVLVAACFAPVAEAGVAYVSQEGRVESVVGTGDLLGALAGGAPITERDRDEASTDGPPGSTFDEFTDASFTDPDDATDTQTAAAVQGTRPFFADGFLRSFGHVEATSTSDDGVAFGRSALDVLFDVTDGGTGFTLDFSLVAPNGVQAGLPDRGFVRLSAVAADDSETTLIERIVNDDVDSATIFEDGQLADGRYRLAYSLIALAPGEGGERLNYDLDFTVRDIDDNGGGEPIPLPPAAWAAAGTFACYGASRLLGRLRRRA